MNEALNNSVALANVMAIFENKVEDKVCKAMT